MSITAETFLSVWIEDLTSRRGPARANTSLDVDSKARQTDITAKCLTYRRGYDVPLDEAADLEAVESDDESDPRACLKSAKLETQTRMLTMAIEFFIILFIQE